MLLKLGRMLVHRKLQKDYNPFSAGAKPLRDFSALHILSLLEEDFILDYDIVTVQTSQGTRLAAVEKKPISNGEYILSGKLVRGEMVRIIAMADNEQQLHEIVQKRIQMNKLDSE